MKKYVFFFVLTVLSFSCKKEPEQEISEIKITIERYNDDELFLYMCGVGSVTIDWGDKTPVETHTLIPCFPENSGFYCNMHGKYYHFYTRRVGQGQSLLDPNFTITLKSEDITHLFLNDFRVTNLNVNKNKGLLYLECSRNFLWSLDISGTDIKGLSCSNNRLTSLIVNNQSLETLGCSDNQLSSDALNHLFSSLHSNNFRKMLWIYGNPGLADCDVSIATDKGWEINPY